MLAVAAGFGFGVELDRVGGGVYSHERERYNVWESSTTCCGTRRSLLVAVPFLV